ncbi:fimbrial protein [Cedecea sp.]|jgi:type 1 fimbria pilin|uniref:fimbrial protein n=1 Tax=Cedecea sp. TaxID=1970739 RepID=UPI002F40CCED
MRNALIVLPLLTLPLTVLANTSVVVNVTGHLYAPTSCSLTTPPTVAFGDVLTTDVDSGNSRSVQPIDITLTCQDRNPIQSVMVQIEATGGNGNLIPVNGAKGLELSLKRAGNDQNLATPIQLDTDGPLNLSLMLVKKSGEDYDAGAFTATATVKVDVV